MKYTKTAATCRVDYDLEGAPTTLVPFDVNNTEFMPDFCVVTIALHDTDGPQVTKVQLSGPRILTNGNPGRAIEHYVWKLSDEVGGLFPDPPLHVQELADSALDVVVGRT